MFGGILPCVSLSSKNAFSGVATLLADSFVDADNTTLNNHTMNVGPGWSVGGTSCKISSNKAVRAALTGESLSESGQADVTVSTAVVFSVLTADAIHGVLARAADLSNYWLFGIDPVVATPSGYYLYLRSGGTFSLQASSAAVFLTSTTYTLNLVCSGTSILGFANGVQVVSTTSSTFQSNTLCGIRAATGAATFDDFLVTKP